MPNTTRAYRLKRFREYCLGLPGVEEKTSWGHPTFRIGGKMFAAVGDAHGGFHLAFPVADKKRLMESDPRFQPINYPNSAGWLFYFFDERPDDWKALEQLLAVGWEIVMARLPKRAQDRILPPKKAAAPARASRPAKRPARRKARRAGGRT